MKNVKFLFLIVIVTISLSPFSAMAHDAHEHAHPPKTWTIDNQKISGHFFLFRDGQVYLENEQHKLLHFPMASFSKQDQAYIQHRVDEIEALNKQITANKADVLPPNKLEPKEGKQVAGYWIWLAAILLILAVLFLVRSRRFRAAIPMLVSVLMLLSFINSPARRTGTLNDPVWMDSAFSPFRPAINTRWDANWFYVESKGLPSHLMMTGITSWQQQVPIPQCYIGSNAWSIPLNPVKAATPVPVNNKHFLRGAVAIAANGIPIFNPYTNTGVDAFLDGQLDQWGGHSGRADDYHYHIAPLFLEAKSGRITPIGFALDGYAIFGSKEPDGSTMATLDANHGHTWKDGRYHYHGTAAAPYMIGNMVGQVTEDTTLQIVPQAVAKGVRPALTPLKGATITGFHPNGNNGYTLIYTLSGATDSIVYSWNQAGNFVYDFYASGVKTTNNYNGKTLCEVPGRVNHNNAVQYVLIYPNPASDILSIQLKNGINAAEIDAVELYNQAGEKVYHAAGFQPSISVSGMAKGIYWLKMKRNGTELVNKVIIK